MSMIIWLYLERKKEKSRKQLAKPDWPGRMVIKLVCVCVNTIPLRLSQTGQWTVKRGEESVESK